MYHHVTDVPELVPVLARGKHRNPRRGACFMELASYLAGERWSDHPACTHPLLASVARLVNDNTSDEGRNRLVELVPSVIGLVSDDPRADVRVTLRAAATALPVVSAERQRVLAVGILAGERVLAELEGRPLDSLQERSRRALAEVPHAARWARRLTPGFRITVKGFRRHSAPSIVRCSVEGIACACVSNPDDLLRDLLVGAITECARYAEADEKAGDSADEKAGDMAGYSVASPPSRQTLTVAEAKTHTARAAAETGRNSSPRRRRWVRI